MSNKGYADYQRIVNWDDSPFSFGKQATLKEVTNLGTFDVSRYAYLAGNIGGRFLKENGMIEWEFTWSLDEEGKEIVGQRIFFTHEINGPAQLRIPNMGPWVTIVAKPFTTPVKTNLTFFPTNRSYPYELLPKKSLLVEAVETAVLSKAVKQFFMEEYFAGPAVIYLKSLKEAGVLTVSTVDLLTNYVNVGIVEVPALGQTWAKVVLPFGPCRLNLENTGAAESKYLINAMASFTGST